MSNFYIYLPFLLFLAGIIYMLKRPRQMDAYHSYLILLAPAFLLLPLGIYLGTKHLPPYKVVLHGYHAEPNSRGKISVGSDIGFDDIRFHFRHQGKELFDPGIIEFSFGQERGRSAFLVTQKDPSSKNTVHVDGLPIRALSLEEGKDHRITFAAFNYSQEEKHVLHLMVHQGKPVFRYRDKVFSKGFSKEILGGLASVPYPEGQLRHLAVGNRIQFDGLKHNSLQLLKQAALLRHGGKWWLAANDAAIRLDNLDFPNSIGARSGALIELSTKELGSGRKTTDFRVYPPNSKGEPVTFQLRNRKTVLLPKDQPNQRICLTANESFYTGTLDIKDPQFPQGGAMINREMGEKFVFRGNYLEKGEIYRCGKAVFSIDAIDRSRLMSMAWFAWLFLGAAFFVRPELIRKHPSLAVLISSSMFLLAFRQLLAFRAWQGPPFKESILMDSFAAPYLFMLLVLVLASRYHTFKAARYIYLQIFNFFVPSHRKPLPRLAQSGDGRYLLAMGIYGGLLSWFFKERLGLVFPMLIVLSLCLSLMLNFLGEFETRLVYYSSVGLGLIRWKPALMLLPFLIFFIVSAPLLGGKEVISILPIRLRPDILVQMLLLFTVAYFASVWVKEASHHVPNPIYILATLAFCVLVPLAQGKLSDDMGFFLMTSVPLLLMLTTAVWKLDHRVRWLMIAGIALVVLSPLFLRSEMMPLDKEGVRRIAFIVDSERLKAEYFHDYLAHLPILWASDQGVFGGGFFTGDWYNAIGETSVNDNVASVFVQGELGSIGTVLVMTVFSLLSLSIIAFVSRYRQRRGTYKLWFLLGASLMLIWNAATMFLANLGYFPLTGKNLPFLGIDSVNDVIRYGLLIGFTVRYMAVLEEND